LNITPEQTKNDISRPDSWPYYGDENMLSYKLKGEHVLRGKYDKLILNGADVKCN
jgi:hypothetical protein